MILVVEDDAVSREALNLRLKKMGHKVKTAKNGLEALAVAGEETPSLILMDLCMPEMDGLATTRKLRSAPNTARVPIIALTALTSREDVMAALEAGCDAYETKPVVLPRLLAKMRALRAAAESDKPPLGSSSANGAAYATR